MTSCSTLTIPTPAIFKPLEKRSRFKAAWGGRGSGKSWHSASMVVEQCLVNPGSRIVCIREIQKTLAQSAKALIEAKIQEFDVGHEFRVLFDRIAMLRPTIRKAGSELWFTWNPRRRSDPVDEFFRGDLAPENSIVVKANFNDNPFFPEVLDEERKLDFARYPDRYEHIWLGDYAKAFEGAYYAQVLAQARRDGRIGDVILDPILPLKLFWDIGGAGAKADACAIWVTQFAGEEILVLDYIEGQGQVLGYYTNELHHRGYAKATCYLPHDGMNANTITGLRYADHLRDAGFYVEVVPNQGAGAAAMRIEAVRRIFPRCRFNETKCQGGLDALGFYHEKKDEQRDVGLGPSHDWSSHGADALGLMAISWESPGRLAAFRKPIVYPNLGIV